MNNILVENFEYVNTEELCERETEIIGKKNDKFNFKISNDNLFMIVYSDDSLFIYKI